MPVGLCTHPAGACLRHGMQRRTLAPFLVCFGVTLFTLHLHSFGRYHCSKRLSQACFLRIGLCSMAAFAQAALRCKRLLRHCNFEQIEESSERGATSQKRPGLMQVCSVGARSSSSWFVFAMLLHVVTCRPVLFSTSQSHQGSRRAAWDPPRSQSSEVEGPSG